MAARAPNIGLGQARRLCQMGQRDRLAFIARGLPIVLRSARGFWEAASQLDDQVREAVVLERHAAEEAAKVLILMDMVRCPDELASSRMGRMVRWFYSHLARLIYAEAVGWRPTSVAELRGYVDLNRRSHYVEGAVGEYIAPNATIFDREGFLYTDIASYEEDAAIWSDPADLVHEFSFSGRPPDVLRLAESMERLGMFTERGVQLTAQVWGEVAFSERESFWERNKLTRALRDALIADGLPAEEAEHDDEQLLFEKWPLPMYDFDFGLTEVPLADLQDEQEAALRTELGADRF